MNKHLKILITLLICFLSTQQYSQELNQKYFGIVSSKSSINHYLEFKNDSIVELTPVNQSMQSYYGNTLKYSRENRTITIEIASNENRNSENIIRDDFFHFSEPVLLHIDKKALLDKKNDVVYILSDDFKKRNYTTFIIDGEEFRQESLMTYPLGFLSGDVKKNRKLKRKLRKIKSDLDSKNYNIIIYRGLDAYLKFGYDKVFGVVELNRK